MGLGRDQRDGLRISRRPPRSLPPSLSPADNEVGWRMSLGKLAALVEADGS